MKEEEEEDDDDDEGEGEGEGEGEDDGGGAGEAGGGEEPALSQRPAPYSCTTTTVVPADESTVGARARESEGAHRPSYPLGAHASAQPPPAPPPTGRACR